MRRGKGKRVLAGLLAAALCVGLFSLLTPAAPEGTVVWGYSERLTQCELAGKWGYVDADRNVAIPFQYDSIVSFRLGIAAVNSSGKLGMVRQDGRYPIQSEYDTLPSTDCGLYIAQKGGGWGVVSIFPFPDGAGSTTNVLYELSYNQVQVAEQSGTQVLTLTKGSTVTKVPVYDLPGVLAVKGASSAQLPLTRGKLPSFFDVSPRDWFVLRVDIAHNVELTPGVGEDRYASNQILIVVEVLKLAATIESCYQEDDFHLSTEGGPHRYVPAVDYCLASGMIQKGDFTERDYGRAITQREATELFAVISLAKVMLEPNSLARAKASVPDIRSGDEGVEAIYSLYVKGILSGMDGRSIFRSEGTFTWAKAAATVFRMARTEQRPLLWS